MASFNHATGDAGLAVRLRQTKAQAMAQWQALGERERLVLATVAALLGLLLAWSLLLAPALRTLKTAPAELEQLELQLQQMQAQAQEARTLRAAPAVPPAQAQAALTASVEHLGPWPASTSRATAPSSRSTASRPRRCRAGWAKCARRPGRGPSRPSSRAAPRAMPARWC